MLRLAQANTVHHVLCLVKFTEISNKEFKNKRSFNNSYRLEYKTQQENNQHLLDYFYSVFAVSPAG